MKKKGQPNKPTAGDVLIYKRKILGITSYEVVNILVDIYGTLYEFTGYSFYPYGGNLKKGTKIYTPKKKYTNAERNALTKYICNMIVLLDDLTTTRAKVSFFINKVRPNTIPTKGLVENNSYYKIKPL